MQFYSIFVFCSNTILIDHVSHSTDDNDELSDEDKKVWNESDKNCVFDLAKTKPLFASILDKLNWNIL